MNARRVALFWEKVARRGDSDCWEWLAGLNNGYGWFRADAAGNKVYAHRVAYELLVGPIPAGLVIDHLCRNPACVNPAHMEPVTDRENILRGTAPTALNARQAVCRNGHPFTGTYRGRRTCRTCQAARVRRYKARKRASRVPA